MRKGTRDECIAWLDARVLALRAALTPPGHVLVGPDARETVARALTEERRRWEKSPLSESYECDCVDDEERPAFDGLCDGCKSAERDTADAVLRALGVRGGA